MPAASSRIEPARLRLGIDDLADLALPHEGGRARAGRGVGEQQLHVARPDVAAIDAIGRSRLALDAARDFEGFVVIELGRRRTLLVLERHQHFRHVAGGPLCGAGEDDIVHAGGAHALVGAFAHHPAQRFEQVRLAAAIGADDAGQALFDDNSVGSTNDLKPESLSRVNFITPTPVESRRRDAAARSSGSIISLEFLDCRLTLDQLTIDEEGRNPLDPEFARRPCRAPP